MGTTSDQKMIALRQEGYDEGWKDMGIAVLDHLEKEYLSDELEDPHTDEGRAILAVARKLSAALSKDNFGEARRKHFLKENG